MHITPYIVLDRQRKIIVVLTVPFAHSHLTLSQYNQISLRYIVVIISCHFLDNQYGMNLVLYTLYRFVALCDNTNDVFQSICI
jgi:hypothetical protein